MAVRASVNTSDDFHIVKYERDIYMRAFNRLADLRAKRRWCCGYCAKKVTR